MKDWLGQLGVVVREPPGDDALEIDYQKLKPLPSFRRRQSGGPQHTKVTVLTSLPGSGALELTRHRVPEKQADS